jgi:hypothetical protein
MLPHSRQVREPQIDHLDVPILEGPQDIVGRGATQVHELLPVLAALRPLIAPPSGSAVAAMTAA